MMEEIKMKELRTTGFWVSMVLIGFSNLLFAHVIYPSIVTAIVVVLVGAICLIVGLATLYVLATEPDKFWKSDVPNTYEELASEMRELD